jgi:hypothetical protein
MNIQQLEREIFWNEHVAATTKDPKQKARCNDRILRFMREIIEIKRAANERDLDRGMMEHAAWNDTSKELAQ